MIDVWSWNRESSNAIVTPSVIAVSAGTTRSRAIELPSRPTTRTSSAPAASTTNGDSDPQSMWGPLM